MKVVMLMFDSLNRHMLPPYGCQWVHAPNFSRLAQRGVTFDNSYVCSMPCIPARRDLHTGRPNFLHRSWGPIEPFDDSVPEILSQNGIYTHLATDHYHYFEEGGCNYHTRYSTWEAFRGQEGDPWVGQVGKSKHAENVLGQNAMPGGLPAQDRKNRGVVLSEEDMPQSQTVRAGLDFMRRNAAEDNWFLQIECFDPHEPFFSLREHQDVYAEHFRKYRGRFFDWPSYGPVTETPEEVEHCRYHYASLLSLCDKKLGEVLDEMDRLHLWEDTMLIVWTDHGFMLGEHDSWAKMWMPFYQEVCHTPFFVWDPRSGKTGERRQALVQPSIDLGPTLLDFFGVPATPDMTGKSLGETIANDKKVRDYAIFGIFGGDLNITDGVHKYMRASVSPENQPLFEHTLMPAHMRRTFPVEELNSGIELHPGFSFTKGCQVMRIPSRYHGPFRRSPAPGHLLYNVVRDPAETCPLIDSVIENRFIGALRAELCSLDTPADQNARLGLE